MSLVNNDESSNEIKTLEEILNEFQDLLNVERNNGIRGGIRSCMEIVYQKKKILIKK